MRPLTTKDWIVRLGGRGLFAIKHLLNRNLADNYEVVLPTASYAPWRSDREFVECYRKIKGNTLVDVFRCHELWQLVGQLKSVEGAILEVGVWRGGTGGLMAVQANRCGMKEPVYLADTFSGVVKATAKDSRYRGGEHSDTSRGIVEHLLQSELGVSNFRILQGIFPDDTAGSVADPKFRLCHIDVDVYASAKGVLDWVWPRLSVGGVVVYDDYGFAGTDGVTQHVNEQRSLPDRVVIHNLNGHAVVIKTR